MKFKILMSDCGLLNFIFFDLINFFKPLELLKSFKMDFFEFFTAKGVSPEILIKSLLSSTYLGGNEFSSDVLAIFASINFFILLE